MPGNEALHAEAEFILNHGTVIDLSILPMFMIKKRGGDTCCLHMHNIPKQNTCNAIMEVELLHCY